MLRLFSPLKNKLPPPTRITHKLFCTLSTQEPQPALRATFAKYQSVEKSRFKEANCLVTLSIGQPVHEGEYLDATVQLVNQNFKECTFVLGDVTTPYFAFDPNSLVRPTL